MNRDASEAATIDIVAQDQDAVSARLAVMCDGPAGERRAVALVRSPLVFGRSRHSDVVLRDPGVSRRHVIIERTSRGWAVRRCEGAASLYVNQSAVERALLRVGDVVRIGRCSLALVDASDVEEQQLETVPDPPRERSSEEGPRYLGTSPAAQRLQDMLARVARSEATVLIVGETGTGKSLTARLLHEQSTRAGRPFLALNCAAIPESLIESELFGHARGAFTGAVEARAGAFEAAGNGTIFLDEISELPLASQSKLLRVLEERCFQRLGSTRQQAMEARVIAATNADLSRMVEEGRMRRDLFYRLSVVRLETPPLRERGQDVLSIAEHMLQELVQRDRRSIDGFAADAVHAICSHDWPGNVRELRNAVECAVVLAQGPLIAARDLPIPAPSGLAAVADDEGDVIQLPMNLAQLEQRAIQAALRVTNGNRTRAASLLGINRVTLYKKLCAPPVARADEPLEAERESVA